MLQHTYRISPAIVSRNIAGETLLIPICQKVSELKNIYTLNEPAARAWSLLKHNGCMTLDEILQQILAEYEVPAEQARQDLIEMFEQLGQIGAIVCG